MIAYKLFYCCLSFLLILAVNVSAGDTASLIYLWNPWTIITCVGSCTSPIENLMVVIMIYGACSRKWNLLCLPSLFSKLISLILLYCFIARFGFVSGLLFGKLSVSNIFVEDNTILFLS